MKDGDKLLLGFQYAFDVLHTDYNAAGWLETIDYNLDWLYWIEYLRVESN